MLLERKAKKSWHRTYMPGKSWAFVAMVAPNNSNIQKIQISTEFNGNYIKYELCQAVVKEKSEQKISQTWTFCTSHRRSPACCATVLPLHHEAIATILIEKIKFKVTG